jgi:hypothetical protein
MKNVQDVQNEIVYYRAKPEERFTIILQQAK